MFVVDVFLRFEININVFDVEHSKAPISPPSLAEPHAGELDAGWYVPDRKRGFASNPFASCPVAV